MVSKRRQIAEGWERDSQHPTGAHGERLPDVHQIGGEEDHQQDLAELGRLEADRTKGHPEPGPVDLPAEDGGEEQQQQPGDADHEAVVAQHLEIADEDQDQQEGDQADHQPHGLLQGQLLVQPVDHQDPQGREQRRHRQKVGIGVRRQHPAPDVGYREQSQEERPIGQRRPGERRGLLRVDQREPQSGEDQRGNEKDELAVAGAHCWALRDRRNSCPSSLVTRSRASTRACRYEASESYATVPRSITVERAMPRTLPGIPW